MANAPLASATPRPPSSRSPNHSLRRSLKATASRLISAASWPSSATALTSAAAEAPGRDRPLEAVEHAQDLLEGRPVGDFQLDQAARQVGGDQRVLGRVVIVEGALADADLVGNRVPPIARMPCR